MTARLEDLVIEFSRETTVLEERHGRGVPPPAEWNQAFKELDKDHILFGHHLGGHFATTTMSQSDVPDCGECRERLVLVSQLDWGDGSILARRTFFLFISSVPLTSRAWGLSCQRSQS